MAAWLPIEFETPDKPETLQIAAELGISADEAFGKCFRVWRWFDAQTVDGVAANVSPAMLDIVTQSPGLAAAMAAAGWLQVDGENLVMPHFRCHCGESAKKRLQAARRQERRRNKEDGPPAAGGSQPPPAAAAPARRAAAADLEALPPWPELADLAAVRIEPAAAAGKLAAGGVFTPITATHLRNAAALAEWHQTQLAAPRPAVGGTAAHRALCVAAGLYAAKSKAAKPVGLFVSIVHRGDWDSVRGQLPAALRSLEPPPARKPVSGNGRTFVDLAKNRIGRTA